MSDTPPGSLDVVAKTNALLEDGRLCLLDMQSKILGIEGAGETPPFCKSIEMSGLDGLTGSYTITLTIDHGKSTFTASHTHD